MFVDMNDKTQKNYQSHQDVNTIDGTFIANVIHDVMTVKLESEDV